MSFQLVGQAVGSFFGPIGTFVGGVIGGLIDRSTADGPSPGDLSAPGLQLGRQLPRVYGRVRLPVNPIWASSYRATEHSSGGKGAPSGPSSFTYSLDLLGAICDGTNVLAVTRIWVNKKLVYTALADSTDASVINSQDTDYWSSLTLQTGGPSQVPWSVYEDAVTAANAPAYRNLCTIGFADLQCGGSKTPPAIEVEVITAGAQGDTGALTRLQSYFTGNVSTDVSYFANGASTAPTNYASFSGEAFKYYGDLNSDNTNGGYAEWVDSDLGGTYGGPVTIEGFIDFTSLNDEAQVNFFTWIQNSADLTTRYDLCAYANGGPGTHELAINVGAFGIDGLSGVTAAGTGRHHWCVQFGTLGTAAFIDGVQFFSIPGDGTPTAGATGTVRLGGTGSGGSVGRTEYELTAFRFRGEIVYDYAGFTPPAEIAAPDSPADTWTPAAVTLDDIVSAELQLNPEVPASDFDVTDLSSIEVLGYTAAGSPAKTCQELCDIHYVDVVPGNPIVFQRRGTAAIATIPFIDTGVGSDGAADGFTGLKRGNADERPAVAAIRFPLLERDHEAGYERGDRLATDTDDVRTIETRVVMSATTAKGRAITATLLDRVRRHTTQFALSDKYAKAEPADVYTPEDNDGNSYRLRISRFSYADGVKSIEWELDDTTALVETGLTDTTYTPSVEIVPPGVAAVLPLDIPLQRVQDDNPGYLAAVKCSDDSRVYYLESPSDTTYTEVAQFPLDAVFGTVSSITGTPSIVATDTGCSITVDVGDGELASVTDASLLLDNTANRFVMGVYGREVIGQFRDCTLSAPGVYVLSGFLWGLNGTAQYVDELIAGDHFCLLNESGGVKHIDRTSAQLGVEHFIKVVPERRSQASITGAAFTNSGIALKPLPGVNPHAERDSGTGDITITWDRQTRHPTRFGGDLGDSCPLGEESERYQVRLYTDNTFATLVREFDIVTTAEVVYTSAQRTTDSHTPITAALYFDVRQISATVGEGYALQATL
jgi:hypothetical protein